MRSLKLFLTWKNLAVFLLILAVFMIPIERRYDKAFRYFSLKLIPEGLILPPFFEKKISYYPTDLIIGFLFALVFFKQLVLFQKYFFQKPQIFLGTIFLLSLLSISGNAYSHYPLMYIHCIDWLIPFFLFTLLISIPDKHKKTVIHLILATIIAAALLQSTIAIIQYFKQESLNLRMFNELSFNPSTSNVPCIVTPNARRWIFDQFSSLVHSNRIVLRASGTFHHPNHLGGFLFFSIMASCYFITRAHNWRRWALSLAIFLQCFALSATYSRSAIFATLLSLGCFFIFLQKQPNRHLIKWVILPPVLSLIACGILFFEQYTCRGGFVNYNSFVKGSDVGRLYYQDIALKMIRDRPILGTGYQSFSLYAPNYQAPGKPLHSIPHNIYLLLAAELGLIALTAFLIWIVCIVHAFFQAEKNHLSITLFSVFLGFLFIGGCDLYPLWMHSGRMLFFLVPGLLYTAIPFVTQEPAQKPILESRAI